MGSPWNWVGGVEVSSKTCNFVLLQLISSPICEDSCAVFLEQGLVFPTYWLVRRHHPHSLRTDFLAHLGYQAEKEF